MFNNLCENKTWLKMISLYLNLFLWSKLQIYLFEHPWDKARYIVPRNELKDMIIHHKVEFNSNKKCCSCCTIVVKDTYKTNHLHGDIQFNRKKYVSNSHTNSLYCPLLKLFKGLKIILIENLYKKFGLQIISIMDRTNNGNSSRNCCKWLYRNK